MSSPASVEPPAGAAAAARLPATAWAVLGILSFREELTGYEIKQWADNILRFFYWSPAMSQIYSELKRLDAVGYASSRMVEGEDGRSKRVYAITPEGQVALTDWVRHAPVEPPVLKHGVALRVWLGHLADPDGLRAIVTRHRDQAQQLIEQAQYSLDRAESEPGWAYPALVARWTTRYYTAERDLAEQMLADLDELATNPPPAPTGRKHKH